MARAKIASLWYPKIMSRKSPQQRISDTEAAIAQWTAAGLQADKRVSFMRDALARLGRGKGLTPKQRKWLDALCADGPPAPKGDPKLIARIDAALPHLREREAQPLREFRHKANMGWKLSEKQAAFMESLLVQGEKVAREGKWKPSPALHAEGLFAAKVVDSRHQGWKSTHPGTASAANRILSGAEEADEWTYNKVISSVGPAVREYHKPKFEEGELVWIAASVGGYQHGPVIPAGTMALVTGGPTAYLGQVGYPVLAGDKATVVNGKLLDRRNPKALI